MSINTVLSLMEEHEPEHTRGVLYLALALYLCNTSRSHESLTVTEQAVHLARRLNDGSLLAQALEERSLALFMVGRHGEAFAPAREALHLCEERGDLGLLGEVLVALVYAHVHRGEFGQGNLYNDRTLEIADALGDTYAAAWAHERRAWIAKFTGHWERAQADLARALQLAPAVAHDPWFNCMRGELCLVQGAWDDAAAFFEQAIAEAASLGLVPAQVCTHAFLAELDVLQGRPAAALARAHAALAQDMGEYAPLLLAWAAHGYLHMGDVDQATSASMRAAKAAIEMDDRLQLSETLRVQALVASARARWLEAEQALVAGLALTRRIGYPYAEARLLHAYGLMHVQKGEVAPARERFDAALAGFRRLGARKDRERIEHDLIDLFP